MVECVKLMLGIFAVEILLFVCLHNVTCLKRFTRYGHYAGEAEGIIKARLAVHFNFNSDTRHKAVQCR